MCFSIQSRSVSLFGKLDRKSLRGMPASRTQICMISRSWVRMTETVSRRLLTSMSNSFGDSLSSMSLVGELLLRS